MELLLNSLVSRYLCLAPTGARCKHPWPYQVVQMHSVVGGGQALRNAPIAATISHLQHAAATLPWNVRVAAVQGLAKVKYLLLCGWLWQKVCSACYQMASLCL